MTRRRFDRLAEKREYQGVPPARRLLALLIVGLLVGLPAVAFADPPDPTWIGGYWDDDDFDNAVVAITTVSAVEGPARFDADVRCWIPLGRLDLSREQIPRTPVRSTASPRAPPVDSPTHI